MGHPTITRLVSPTHLTVGSDCRMYNIDGKYINKITMFRRKQLFYVYLPQYCTYFARPGLSGSLVVMEEVSLGTTW